MKRTKRLQGMHRHGLTVKGRLYVLTAVVSAVLLILGGIGLFGVIRIDTTLRHIFEGRVKALQAITAIDQLVSQSHFAISDAVLDPSAPKTNAVVKQAAQTIRTVDHLLAEYRTARLDPAERQQAARFAGDWAKLRDQGLQPTLDYLKANNLSEAQWVVTQKLEPQAAAVKSESAALRRLQLDSAQTAYDRAQGLAKLVLVLVGACVVGGIVVMGVLCTLMARTLYAQLGGEPAYAAYIAREIAQGNLALEVAAGGAREHSVLGAMSLMRARLADMIGNIKQAADAISGATAEITAGNMELSQRTEEHAAGIQETAASMKQLAATVQANAEHAQQASTLALSASHKADDGKHAAAAAVTRMEALSAQSQKIGHISTVIEGIAFQTKLLALNAAVEAARAGNVGRGFAVVAQEVRALAQRSSEAAREIADLLNDVTAHVDDGMRTTRQTGGTIADMLGTVHSVAGLVDDISTASAEQSAGIAQINIAVAQMDRMTQQNAALVEQAAASAGALDMQAHSLNATVALFQLDQSARLDEFDEFGRAAPRHAMPAGTHDRAPRAAGRQGRGFALV